MIDPMSDQSSSRRYAVVGTGALGGYYGACLQRAGFDVHFLLNRDYEVVAQQGLIIQSIQGDFKLPQVQAYPTTEAMPSCDVILIALKAVHNAVLPAILPPLLQPQSIVLVLQNGLGGEQYVASLIGSERVMGGLCFISSNKIGPGHIHHLDYGLINLADYGDGYQAQGLTHPMQMIASDFEAAGIPVQLSPDLFSARWQKLVWNIPFNGLSVILNATTDQMMSNPMTRSLIEAVMQEVAHAAVGCGAIVPDTVIPDLLVKTEQMVSYRTSMKIDYELGRPLEVEAILGFPLKIAHQQGISLPRIQTLYHLLSYLDSSNRRSHPHST